jgi:hypothetical protein
MEEQAATQDLRKSSYSDNGGSDCVEVGIWRKSSYSNGGTANCIEVSTWRKSSHSGNGGSDCVELGHAQTAVLVRDTKDNGTGLTLRVTPSAWARFTTTIRSTRAPS